MLVYIMILSLFFYCENKDSSQIINHKNITSEISFEEAKDIMLENDSIQNYILQRANEKSIIVCEFAEDNKYYYFNFFDLDSPIHIKVNYKIFSFKNNYILVAKNEPLVKSTSYDSITQKLITQKIITFENQKAIPDDYNYFNFVVCKENIHKTGYYNSKMERDSVLYKKPFIIEDFNPNCN